MDSALTPVLQAVDDHIEAGDWAAAIDTLVEESRRDRSPELDVALADLRHRAWALVDRTNDSVRVAPGTQSPAIGASGLPEADWRTLDAGAIRAAINDNGSLLLRDAIPADTVASIIDFTERAVAVALSDDRSQPALWRPLKIHPDVEATAEGTFRPMVRPFVHEAGGVLLADAPSAMFDLLDVFERVGLRSMVTDFLGSRPIMSAHKSTLRRVPLSAVGGWHQDGAFLGGGIRAINIWIALTDCGIDAPGLDIVPRRLDHIVETGTEGSYFDWDVSERLVDGVAGDYGIVRPEFSAGDLLLFDEMLLHRTAVTPEMTHDRHAIEFWNFSAGSYPVGQVPLVW